MLNFSSVQLDTWIAGFLWPFIRILALISSAPVIGHRGVPMRVKVGLAALMAMLIAPTIQNGDQFSIGSSAGFILVLQQVLIGVAMGFTLRIIFAAVELAGEVIGTQMGLNFAGFFDPQSSQQGTPIGAWLGLLITLIFLAMNGHLMLLASINESFRIVPIAPDAGLVGDWRKLALIGSELFRIGLYASLPVIAAMLTCNIALGVLARVAPQLNVLAVGFSITILVGFLVLYLSLPVIGVFLQGSIERGMGLMLWR
ncbi:MAG: flagellar biosynthetic protein FliR [Burkholderiales bacterium]